MALHRWWRVAAVGVGPMLAAPAFAQAPPPVEEPGPVEEPARVEEPLPVEEPAPWRVAEAVGSPEWLRFGLVQRTRYEHLFDSFRAGRPGDGGLLNFRTHLSAELRPGPVRIGAELLDSRAYLSNEVSAPTTGEVNPLEPLQAYLALELHDAFTAGDHLRAAVGRFTLDIGGRRLSARNGYRNTINAFTGIDVVYALEGGPRFRTFATMPIDRRPNRPRDLADNVVEIDRESFDVVFAGQHVTSPTLGPGLVFEVYAFELAERDGPERPTANRRLVTPGVRLLRAPEVGRFDLELETAVQIGRSRASADRDDLEDLDHLASMQHAEVGYTFDVPSEPRVAARYDQASGDGDPRDGTNGRFDSLYGGRRFEYGPTGIYGPFSRSNLRSPGAVVELTSPPTRAGTVSGMLGWRALWLAQARDAWIGSGLRDPTGQSGNFLGHQLEGSLRYEPFVGNLQLEVGAAHLFAGRFVSDAPGANPDTQSTVVYAQVVSQL